MRHSNRTRCGRSYRAMAGAATRPHDHDSRSRARPCRQLRLEPGTILVALRHHARGPDDVRRRRTALDDDSHHRVLGTLLTCDSRRSCHGVASRITFMSTPSTRLLIADDQRDVLEALRLLLKAEGYQIDDVESPAAVLKALEQRDYDVVLIDLNYARDTTSGQEGLELLTKIHSADEMLPVVVMTAWGSVNVAVEAMRRGARDFIEKPWDNERLKAIVRTQTELGRALRRAIRLEAQSQTRQNDGGPLLIADSAAMQPVLQIIARVGPSDANVLITGENGTGKGVVAQALHAVSARANRPMVTINAGGVSEGVFESELFGHVKGAFTDAKQDRVGRFELADGSSLFLDEIANVPLSQQQKLLRVLETGEFERLGSSRTRKADVRLISATNAD